MTRRLMIGSLIGITVLAYFPSFQGAFVFDDDPHIRSNKAIRSFELLRPQLLKTCRPVVFVSLAGNYWLGDLKTSGYHVWNLAVHLAAGLALFGIVRQTVRLPAWKTEYGRSADWIAFSIALVWLVHPMQTQAVTYVIQRCESMMGMFYLVCLYCAIRAARSPRAWIWYLAAAASGWLGMGCKEVMATAPVVIALYDRTFLYSSWKEQLRRRSFLYLSFLPAIAWIVIAPQGGELEAWHSTAGFGCHSRTPWTYLLSQAGVILYYLRLAIMPDRLCFDHWWPVAHAWREIAIPGVIVISLLIGSLLSLRFRPAIGFLGLAFFLILAPSSSIIPIFDLCVEHRMYLPLAAMVTLLVFAFLEGARRIVPDPRQRSVICASVAVVVVAPFVLRTMVRNTVYQSPVSVWSNTTAVAPHNPRAYVNLAYYLEAADVDRALATYQQAIAVDPDFSAAYCNAGDVLAVKKNDFDAAMAKYREGLAASSEVAYVHFRCGQLLEKLGKYGEAATHFRAMNQLRPDLYMGYYRLGRSLVKAGDCHGAIAELKRGEQTGHKKATWNFFLAAAYQRSGALAEAASHYKKALELDPKHEHARKNLKATLAGKTEADLPPDKPGNALPPSAPKTSRRENADA